MYLSKTLVRLQLAPPRVYMFEKVKNIAIISRDYIFVMGLFAVSYVCSVVGAIGNSIARENIRENKEGDDQHRIT
jgi:hypothetical protein